MDLVRPAAEVAELLRRIIAHEGRGHGDRAVFGDQARYELHGLGFHQGGKLEHQVPALVAGHRPPGRERTASRVHRAVDVGGARHLDLARDGSGAWIDVRENLAAASLLALVADDNGMPWKHINVG